MEYIRQDELNQVDFESPSWKELVDAKCKCVWPSNKEHLRYQKGWNWSHIPSTGTCKWHTQRFNTHCQAQAQIAWQIELNNGLITLFPAHTYGHDNPDTLPRGANIMSYFHFYPEDRRGTFEESHTHVVKIYRDNFVKGVELATRRGYVMSGKLWQIADLINWMSSWLTTLELVSGADKDAELEAVYKKLRFFHFDERPI